MDWPYHFPKMPFPFEEVQKRTGRQLVPLLIPIQAEGLTLPEIEAAILQVLARGRIACVDEGCLVTALRSDLKQGAVTKWANRFSRQYQFTWKRRHLFEDLQFSLTSTEKDDRIENDDRQEE